MFSIELKSKGKISLDLYKLTVEDVRIISDSKTKPREGDEVLAKTINLTVDEIRGLPFPEYRKLTRFFWQCINDPLKDEEDAKNSVSESTSG